MIFAHPAILYGSPLCANSSGSGSGSHCWMPPNNLNAVGCLLPVPGLVPDMDAVISPCRLAFRNHALLGGRPSRIFVWPACSGSAGSFGGG